MTAEEIRSMVAEYSEIAKNIKDESQVKALAISTPAIVAIYVGEIAAQLAELNENLSKVITKYGTGHVVNVAPVRD